MWSAVVLRVTLVSHGGSEPDDFAVGGRLTFAGLGGSLLSLVLFYLMGEVLGSLDVGLGGQF